jgi:hypothetical protein
MTCPSLRPRDFALALTLPSTRREFTRAKHRGPARDFTQRLDWPEYAATATTVASALREFRAHGVRVVQDATWQDVRRVLVDRKFHVVTLVAHSRPGDMAIEFSDGLQPWERVVEFARGAAAELPAILDLQACESGFLLADHLRAAAARTAIRTPTTMPSLWVSIQFYRVLYKLSEQRPAPFDELCDDAERLLLAMLARHRPEDGR